MEEVRVRIEHFDCFTQRQAEFLGLEILDVNLAEPEPLGGRDIEIFPGYMVLRGPAEDKERFYELCKNYKTQAIFFVRVADPITGFNTEPTVFYYETVETVRPCVLSKIYSSGLSHHWPFIIKVRDGKEEVLLQGTKESIEKFKDEIEGEGIGKVHDVDPLSEDELEEARNALEGDKEIVFGLHILRTMKVFLKSLEQHDQANFLIDVFLNPESSLKDICKSYSEFSYSTGRHIAVEAKRDFDRKLKAIFHIALKDLKNDFAQL